LEISTSPDLPRQPHLAAILSDLGRGGDVEWLAQYLARRRAMDMALPTDRNLTAERIIAWNSRGRR
jgi:hypothetical protein